MRIGLDIDDTFTETKKAFRRSFKKYQKKYNSTKERIENLNYEEYKEFLKEYGEAIYFKVKEKKNASKVVRKWIKEGHQIYFVTARSKDYFEKMEEYTKKYFIKRDIQYEHIFFGVRNKYECIKDLNLDLFIDDQEKVLDSFPKDKLTLLKMIPDKNNYSKYEKVTNWKEIEELVKTMH